MDIDTFWCLWWLIGTLIVLIFVLLDIHEREILEEIKEEESKNEVDC